MTPNYSLTRSNLQDSHRMELPEDTNLPFFAYGLFKPGQLAFHRIKDMVYTVKNAEVPGMIRERDGVPLLVLKENYGNVKGTIISFIQGSEYEAYNRIFEIEPGMHYAWRKVRIGESEVVNVLIGKENAIGPGSFEFIYEDWDGKYDPFFTIALEEIDSIIKTCNKDYRGGPESDTNYRSFFRLQMAYILLWTIIERYATLKYYLGGDISKKRARIAEDPLFQKYLKKFVKRDSTNPIIYSADRNFRKFKLDPNEPLESINYYYTIRSNSVHRGKSIDNDYYLLYSALIELLAIFKDMLTESWATSKI